MKDHTEDEPALKFTPVFENISCLFQQQNAWLFDVDMSSAAVADTNFSFTENNTYVCQPATMAGVATTEPSAVLFPRTQAAACVGDPRHSHHLTPLPAHVPVDISRLVRSDTSQLSVANKEKGTEEEEEEPGVPSASFTSTQVCFTDAAAVCGTQRAAGSALQPLTSTVASPLSLPMFTKPNMTSSTAEDTPHPTPVAATVCTPHMSSAGKGRVCTASTLSRSEGHAALPSTTEGMAAGVMSTGRGRVGTEGQAPTQPQAGSMPTATVCVVDVPHFITQGSGLPHLSHVRTGPNNIAVMPSNGNTINTSNSTLVCAGAAETPTVTFPCPSNTAGMTWMHPNTHLHMLVPPQLPPPPPPPPPPLPCAEVGPPCTLMMNEAGMSSCHIASQPFLCRLAPHAYAQSTAMASHLHHHHHHHHSHHHHQQHHHHVQQQQQQQQQYLSLQQLSLQQQQQYIPLGRLHSTPGHYTTSRRPYTESNTSSSRSASNVGSKDHMGNESSDMSPSPRLTGVLLDVFDPSYTHLYQVPQECVVQLPPARLNIHRLVLCKNYQCGKADSCPMMLNCKFVHADCDFRTLTSYPVHVNYVWRNPELCIYRRLPPGDVVHVIVDRGGGATSSADHSHTHTQHPCGAMVNAPPHRRGSNPPRANEECADGMRRDVVVVAMESQRVLRTRGALTALASRPNPASSSCSTVSSYSSTPQSTQPLRSCPAYDREGTCLQGEQCEYAHCVLVDPNLTRDFKRATRKVLDSVSRKGYYSGSVTDDDETAATATAGGGLTRTQTPLRAPKSTRHTTMAHTSKDDTDNEATSLHKGNVYEGGGGNHAAKGKGLSYSRCMTLHFDKDTPLSTHDAVAGSLTHATSHVSAGVVMPSIPDSQDNTMISNISTINLNDRSISVDTEDRSGRRCSVASASTMSSSSSSVCANDDVERSECGAGWSSILHITVPLDARAHRVWASSLDRRASLLLRLDARSTEAEVLCALRCGGESHEKNEDHDVDAGVTGGEDVRETQNDEKCESSAQRACATTCVCCCGCMTSVLCDALRHVSHRVELQPMILADSSIQDRSVSRLDVHADSAGGVE